MKRFFIAVVFVVSLSTGDAQVFDNSSVRVVNGQSYSRDSSSWTTFFGEVLGEYQGGLIIVPHRTEERKTGARITRPQRDGSTRSYDETEDVLVADPPVFIRGCRISDAEQRSGRSGLVVGRVYRGMPTKDTITIDGTTMRVFDYGEPEKASIEISSKYVYVTNKPALRPIKEPVSVPIDRRTPSEIARWKNIETKPGTKFQDIPFVRYPDPAEIELK
jgi:hypothetical protein